MSDKKYRLGFDVGGTFTDGVLISGNDVLAKTKALTTEDVTTGIIAAMDNLLNSSKIDVDNIVMVSFGTTHTTNAIVERKDLNVVGIFRIGLPAATAVPPLCDWPEDLKETIGGDKNVYMFKGGSQFNGDDIAELDVDGIYKACHELKGKIDSLAITSIFSPMVKTHEEIAAKIAREVLGDDVHITLSNQIASISLLERENSTILNAAVINVMKRAIGALRKAAAERGIKAPLYVVQNDGSVMTADYAINYPIFTVASGPAASIRGAVFLSQIENGVVVDVGGTTTDVAYITNGFPRESSVSVNIGGVKTNIRCPDLLSVGLGGGTIVKTRGKEIIGLGPESVGHNLVKFGRAFGGPILTTHDIAIASGILTESLDIFETKPYTTLERIQKLPEETVKKAYDAIKEKVEIAIDQMKTVADDIPAVFIGGGAMVVPDKDINGTTKVVKPENFEVGGAVGTTIAEIGSYAEGAYDLELIDRDKAIQEVADKAREGLRLAGGIPETAEIVDIEEIPFVYMPGKRESIRVRMKGKAF